MNDKTRKLVSIMNSIGINFRRKVWITSITVGTGFVVLFAPMFIKLFSYGWKNANYDHGVFILPIALYLIWLKRKSIVFDESLKWKGIFNLLFAVLLHLYSFYNDFLFLQVIAFIWIFSSMVYLNVKADSFRELIFPITYLFFMVPPPGLLIDALTIHLKEVSMHGAYWFLKTFGIPVQIEGLILRVSDVPLLITEACSGYRSIVTLCALGAVYAYSQKMAVKKKWAVFAMVFPFAVVGNILRIAVTGLIALRFDEKYAEGFFHETSSVIVFACTVLGLMFFSSVLKKSEAS